MRFLLFPIVAGVIAALLLQWIAPSHMPHFTSLAAGVFPSPLAGFSLAAFLAVFVDRDNEAGAWIMAGAAVCYAVAISLLASSPSLAMAAVGAVLMVSVLVASLLGASLCESICLALFMPESSGGWDDSFAIDLDIDTEFEEPAAA